MTRHEIITFSQRHIIYTMCMWINPGIHPLKYAFSCNLLILSTLVLSSFLLLPCHFSCIGTCILLFSPTFSSLLLPSPLFSCLLNTSLGTIELYSPFDLSLNRTGCIVQSSPSLVFSSFLLLSHHFSCILLFPPAFSSLLSFCMTPAKITLLLRKEKHNFPKSSFLF